MDSTPSLLTAGLAIFSALLYLLAVWRQVLNLECLHKDMTQQIHDSHYPEHKQIGLLISPLQY